MLADSPVPLVRDPATIAREAERRVKRQLPWWRRHGGFLAAVIVAALLAGLVATLDRAFPPASPPNAATQQELDKLRSDLDSYLKGRGGLRDEQYARTVYSLCVLAQDAGETDILNDPDYDCKALLASPPPSVMTSAPPVTGPSPTSSASTTARATPTGTVSPRPSAPTPSAAGTPTRTPTTPTAPTSRSTPTSSPTPLLSGVLCNLPILTLCPGGTP